MCKQEHTCAQQGKFPREFLVIKIILTICLNVIGSYWRHLIAMMGLSFGVGLLFCFLICWCYCLTVSFQLLYWKRKDGQGATGKRGKCRIHMVVQQQASPPASHVGNNLCSNCYTANPGPCQWHGKAALDGSHPQDPAPNGRSQRSSQLLTSTCYGSHWGSEPENRGFLYVSLPVLIILTFKQNKYFKNLIRKKGWQRMERPIGQLLQYHG